MKNIEYEIDEQGRRTGRWRARQFYAKRAPDGTWMRLPPSELQACAWREPRGAS